MTWTHTIYLSPEVPRGGDRLPVHCTLHRDRDRTVLRAVGCDLRAPGATVAVLGPRGWKSPDGSRAAVWERPRPGYRRPAVPSYPAWIPDRDGRLGPVVVHRGDLVGGELRVTDAPWPRRRGGGEP